MSNARIVCCDGCGGEGRVLYSDGGPYDTDGGPCPWCEETGGAVIETEPVDLADISDALVPA